jgi:hypothetical protein
MFPLPTVLDACSPVGPVTCVPPPGSFFPVGITPVQCTAMDAAGNVGTCSFMVRVIDAQRPTITCPADISVTNAHDAATAVVTFNPTVSDNCPGLGLPICNPPSGSAFPVGTTTVTCSAIDASGSASQCSFRVTVYSGNAPPVPIIDISPLAHFPGNTNLFVIARNGTDASVTLNGSGSYDPDDATFLYYWYEGTNLLSTNVVTTQDLPVGTHTLTLLLDDTFPHGTNSASVDLHVLSPVDSVGVLIDLVENSDLGGRNRQPLLATLYATAAAFETGNITAALNQLHAFESKVTAQIAPVEPALAAQLIGSAEVILKAFDFTKPLRK